MTLTKTGKNLFRSLWPFVIMALLVFVFYWQFIFRGLLPIPGDIIVGAYYPWLINAPTGIAIHNPLPSDVVSLTYPLRFLAISYLKSGILPLWNQHILAGIPLLANFQTAALYPLNLLYFLSNNFPLIWSVQVVGQSLLALLFMYLFLRSHSLTKASSLFGASVWGLGGFTSLWLEYNTVVHAVLYLPLILWSIRRLPQNHLFGVVATFGLAASLTAGNPPLSLIVILTCSVYALSEYHHRLKSYLILLFFALLGFGLASPQLLPGLEIAKNSIRDYDQVAVGSGIKFLPLHKLITLTTPDFFGSPATYNLWSLAGLYDNLTIYSGLIPFVLFLVGLSSAIKKEKLMVFALILFGISLILMIDNPLSRFIGNLSYLGLSAMVMTRFSVLTNFAIAVGSAITIDRFAKKRIRLRQFFKPLFLIFGMIMVPLAVMLLIWWISAPTISFVPNQFFPPEIRSFPATIMVSFRNSLLPLFLLTAVIICLISAVKLSFLRKPSILISLLFVLTFLDLFRFFAKYNSFTPQAYLYPDNKVTRFLKENDHRFVTSIDPILPANMWLIDSLNSINGQDTLHSLYYSQFISLINNQNLKTVGDRYVKIKNFDNPFLDFLDVKYILSLTWKNGRPDTSGRPNYPLDDQTKYPIVFTDGYTAVLERKNSSPQIFSPSRYVIAKNLEAEQELLKTSDLSEAVVLNETPKIGSGKLAKAAISSVSEKGNEIVFTTRSGDAALVVLATAFYPGWNYYLDGVKQDPPLRANHAFLAVPLPPGEHAVRLVYLPASFKSGLITAAVSFLALILFLFSHIIRSFYERRSSR